MGKNIPKKITLSKDVIFRKFDECDGILVNFATKNYYALNETACFIVDRVKSGGSLPDIFDSLKREYDADPRRLKDDLRRIFADLKREKMLSDP
jgi:hypothetical protein